MKEREMTFHTFKRTVTLACLVFVMLAVTACGGGQTADVLVVDEPTEVTTQNVLTVQQARDLLDDVFSDSGTITYRAMQDKTVGDVRFYAFEVNTSDDGRVYAMAWVNSITGAVDVEEVEQEEVKILSMEEALEIIRNHFDDIDKWYEHQPEHDKVVDGVMLYCFLFTAGDAANFEYVNSVTGEITQEPTPWFEEMMQQEAMMQQEQQPTGIYAERTDLESGLIGKWVAIEADHDNFLRGDTVSFSTGGTGEHGVSVFTWNIEVVEPPGWDEGYLILRMVYVDFELDNYFPVINGNLLRLSDYTGELWVEFIKE